MNWLIPYGWFFHFKVLFSVHLFVQEQKDYLKCTNVDKARIRIQ